MARYGKRPGSLGLAGWLTLAVLIGGGYGGYRLYRARVLGAQDATLSCSLRIAESQADCEATFHRYPASGDPTDVLLRLSGPTLVEEVAVDWAFLAPLDKREGPAPNASEPPPLERPLRWRVPVALVPRLQPGVGDFIVRAKLFWAGRQQDLARFNTKVVYTQAP